MNIENITNETLTRAMANRNLISFEYNNFSLYGKETQKEEIGNAHIILISTNKSGQSTVMVDFKENKKGRNVTSWRHFDINKMSGIKIN